MSDKDNGYGEINQSAKAVEIIKLITRTEADCEKKKENASSEARLIVAEAEERAAKSVDFEEAKSSEKIRKVRELTEQKGREIAINILTQVNNDCNEMKERARDNKDSALNAVVERIVKEWQ